MINDQLVAALSVLAPGAQWSIQVAGDPTSIVWLDAMTQPTLDQINAAIAALPPPPVYIQALTLLGRLLPAEYVAIRQAAAAELSAGNGQMEQWLDMARTAPGGVNLIDPATVVAKAAMVSAGLLTQARADAVFAAP